MKPKPPATAIDRLEELLAYRLPQSGALLSTIVLTRADAEAIWRHILELQLKADK